MCPRTRASRAPTCWQSHAELAEEIDLPAAAQRALEELESRAAEDDDEVAAGEIAKAAGPDQAGRLTGAAHLRPGTIGRWIASS